MDFKKLWEGQKQMEYYIKYEDSLIVDIMDEHQAKGLYLQGWEWKVDPVFCIDENSEVRGKKLIKFTAGSLNMTTPNHIITFPASAIMYTAPEDGKKEFLVIKNETTHREFGQDKTGFRYLQVKLTDIFIQ